MFTHLLLSAPISSEETPDVEGKYVRIKRCMAVQYYDQKTRQSFHSDNIPNCVCSFIGKIVKIEKCEGSDFVFKIIFPKMEKFVRERGVELLKELRIGNVPIKQRYVRKNGEFFRKVNLEYYQSERFDEKLQEWICGRIVEVSDQEFDPNEIVQLCDQNDRFPFP